MTSKEMIDKIVRNWEARPYTVAEKIFMLRELVDLVIKELKSKGK